jgi:hypothetical protein
VWWLEVFGIAFSGSTGALMVKNHMQNANYNEALMDAAHAYAIECRHCMGV